MLKTEEDNLKKTKILRKLLHAIELGNAQGRIIRWLYEINLDPADGNLKPGRHMESAQNKAMNAFFGVNLPIEDYSVRFVVDALGLDHTYFSTSVTKLERMGAIQRRKTGKNVYIALKWDYVVQLHEALKSGRLLPATEIKI